MHGAIRDGPSELLCVGITARGTLANFLYCIVQYVTDRPNLCVWESLQEGFSQNFVLFCLRRSRITEVSCDGDLRTRCEIYTGRLGGNELSSMSRSSQ